MDWIPYKDVLIGGIAFLHKRAYDREGLGNLQYGGYLVYPAGQFDEDFLASRHSPFRWSQYYTITKESIARYKKSHFYPIPYVEGDNVDIVASLANLEEAVRKNAERYKLKIVGTFNYDEWDLLKPQEIVYLADDKLKTQLNKLYDKYKPYAKKTAETEREYKEGVRLCRQWEEVILSLFPALKKYERTKYENQQRFVL
jgi:hypothetical protein